MLTETAGVVAVGEDGLWVEAIGRAACGRCAARKGCGHSLLGRMAARRGNRLRVLPGAGRWRDYRVDDEVRIAIPEGALLRGSAVVYALPLLGLLLGAALAAGALPGQDFAGVAGALAGLASGLAAVRRHARRHRDDSALQPRLLGLARAGAGPEPVAPPG